MRRSVDRLNFDLRPIVALLITCLGVAGDPADACAVPRDGSALPVAVLIADNEFTEITDFLVPFALLSASGGFRVVGVSILPGPVKLWPNVTSEMPYSLGTLDEELPEAPRLIVVPAIHNYDDPELIAWLRKSADRGAMIASICDGAFVTASAGLLDDHRATGHFYSEKKRRRLFPDVIWVRNARYVESGPIFSTAGVSASAPATIRLIEILVGPAVARKTAARYGIDAPSPDHDTDRFHIGASEVWTYVWNTMRGLRRSRYDLTLDDGVDEFSLAFTADLLSRTSRASITTQGDRERIQTAHGLILLPDRVGADRDRTSSITLPVVEGLGWTTPDQPEAELSIADPATVIATVLEYIEKRFGDRTATFVATQLELARD